MLLLAVGGVQVALGGPRAHVLAAGLLDLAEIDEVLGRHREPDLLLELAQRRGEGVLLVGVAALGDRPRADVPPLPHRAAHVAEQHLRDGTLRPGGKR